MPKYRALGPIYIRRLMKAGEEFESELPPGRNWEPLDAEARVAVAKYKAERGKVLSLYDKLQPRAVDKDVISVPKDWKTLSGPKRRALAQRLGAQSNVTEADANSFIEAELERRAQKVA